MANMKLFSEVTGMEYEVKTYPMENGMRGISHESLQDILENHLTEISYNTEVLAATESYCAAKCSIADIRDDGTRKIQAFNDVNTNALEGREPEQEKFARAHPLLAATQSAIDTAVRAYLKWSRCYPDENYGTTIIGEVPENIPEEILDDPNDIANSGILDEATDSKMKEMSTSEEYVIVEGEEESTLNEESADEIPLENAVDETLKADTLEESDENPDERLIELGKKLAPATSKYSTLTLDEIWEKYPGWFNYVKNNSKSPTYVDVREYIQLKEAKEQQ